MSNEAGAMLLYICPGEVRGCTDMRHVLNGRVLTLNRQCMLLCSGLRVDVDVHNEVDEQCRYDGLCVCGERCEALLTLTMC